MFRYLLAKETKSQEAAVTTSYDLVVCEARLYSYEIIIDFRSLLQVTCSYIYLRITHYLTRLDLTLAHNRRSKSLVGA